MWKNILVFIVLMPYSALAQISSGTIIIFNFAKDKVVVAADSRGLNDKPGPPDNSYYKISAFSNKFVFATVGNARYTQGPFLDPIGSWDNGVLARQAFLNSPKSKDGGYDMIATSANWARDVSKKWVPLCQSDPQRCKRLTESSNGVLTGGVFLRAKGLVQSIAAIIVNLDAFNPTINYVTFNDAATCWPCGKKHGRICALGSRVDFAAKFCSERKSGSRSRVHTLLENADGDTRLAVKIVESTIEAYDNSGRSDVGGPVDSVTLNKSGRITWNSRKENCPENQD